MEGLIKGLAHVALDAVQDEVRDRAHGRRGGGDDDEAPRTGAPQRADPDADGEEGRDERSRSTWAEVRARHSLLAFANNEEWLAALAALSLD
jgi:poly(U)-specific endoribonuclease